MLEEILRNIWDGGKGLDLTMCHSERYQEMLTLISECRDELSELHDADGRDLLEELQKFSVSWCAESDYQAFNVGYRFGVKMIIYALQG